MTFEAFVDGEAYAPRAYVEDPIQFGADVRAVPYIRGTRKPVEDIWDFICAHGSVLDGMDVIISDPELKSRLWQMLDAEAEDVYITSSVPQLLEISYKDAGKHTGAAFCWSTLDCGRKNLRLLGMGITMPSCWHSRESGLQWRTHPRNVKKPRITLPCPMKPAALLMASEIYLNYKRGTRHDSELET